MFRNTVRNGQEDEFTPLVQSGEGQQIGEPNSDPNGPNTDPNGPANGSGEPSTNPDGNENNNDSGNGSSNGSGSGEGSNNNESGGSGKSQESNTGSLSRNELNTKKRQDIKVPHVLLSHVRYFYVRKEDNQAAYVTRLGMENALPRVHKIIVSHARPPTMSLRGRSCSSPEATTSREENYLQTLTRKSRNQKGLNH